MTNHTNTVLHTGITNNLEKRVFQHKYQTKNSFTAKYHVYKLVWFEEFRNVTDAIAAEKKIKGWTRVKKIYLIKTINQNFEDLAKR